jgi:uncharacterized membrane protein YkvA (DUF1232 family)
MDGDRPPSENARDAESTALALRPQAEAVVADRHEAEALAEAVLERSRRYRKALGEIWRYVQALARMLRAYARHEYTDIPWRSLVMVAAALLYFLMPLDFIPDFLLGGLVDDAAVIAFVVRQIRRDLEGFLAWERARDATGQPA